MKKYLFYWALNQYRQKKYNSKNFKILLSVVAVAVLFSGAIAVFVAWELFNWARKEVPALVSAPLLQNPDKLIPAIPAEPLAQVEEKLNAIGPLATQGCWNKVESLMAIEVWVTQPFMSHVNDLKAQCFGSSKPEPNPSQTQ